MGVEQDANFLMICAGMESAGTAWFFQLATDLLIEVGETPARELRDTHDLASTMRGENCNVGNELGQEVWDNLKDLASKHRFVVKSHGAPSAPFTDLISSGEVRAAYIYREPGAAALSAWNRGRRNREQGDEGAPFTRLKSGYHAIAKMRLRQLPRFYRWSRQPNCLLVRYEDLCDDPRRVVDDLVDLMGLGQLDEATRDDIAQRFTGGKAAGNPALHYQKDNHEGRRNFSALQARLASLLFGRARVAMGYSATPPHASVQV